jgi:large subunit ribosomal protein L31
MNVRGLMIEMFEMFANIANNFMKPDIHPKYYSEAKVSCACGNKFIIGSTKPEIQIEICSKCHPFYTGKEKFIGIAGRVEKFKARRAKAASAPKIIKKARAKK